MIGNGFTDARPSSNLIPNPSPANKVTGDVRTGGKGQDGRRAFGAVDAPADSLTSNLSDPSKMLSDY